MRMGDACRRCFGMGTYIGLTVFLPIYFEAVRRVLGAASPGWR